MLLKGQCQLLGGEALAYQHILWELPLAFQAEGVEQPGVSALYFDLIKLLFHFIDT